MTKKVNIQTLGSGVLAELFEEDFQKLLNNIADENTKPDAVRELSIKVKIKPSKDRGAASFEVTSNAKLAPIKPFESTMFFQNGKSGVEAFENEITPQSELTEFSRKEQAQ